MAIETSEERRGRPGPQESPRAGRGDSRDRKPKGAPGFLTRVRRFIWSWWIWALAAAAAANWKHWTAVTVFITLAIIVFLFAPTEQSPAYGLDHEFSIESEEFLTTIAGATDTPFTAGNSVAILSNGDEFYPPMLEAVEQARQSITIEAYIYWAGDIGHMFADALAAKARSGVPVKILLDAVGSSNIGDDILGKLEDGGCKVEWYHPIHWYSVSRINNRTHRKSLIIDGRIGFTGGAGIADHWMGRAENKEHWRDTNIRIEGPSVTALQSAFVRNWLETTGELLSGTAYFPTIEPTGNLSIQSILSSPETGSSTVRIMYYLSIVCARKSIFIANPYFIPDEAAIDTLVDARKRGVDVKIMVAGEHNDNKLARLNSTRLYGELLEAGVEIYEYNHTMLHHKFMVCDGVWSTIGTTNFDSRSFALNAENNACVYDKAFAGALEAKFREDFAGCKKVELEAWRDRGLVKKSAELVVSLLREQV